MAIPTYDVLMLPVLRLAAERAWVVRDLTAKIADEFRLTEEERTGLRPGSNRRTLIADRVSWATTGLKYAGLLERPERGVIQITPRGREVLSHNPEKIDVAFLNRFEEFRAFHHRTKHARGAEATPSAALALESSSTPEEQIGAAANALEASLQEELLARVREMPPAFFEKLIIDLLLAMGYGGSRSDAGEHLGRTGDGGVDGIIREDQLGLDRVYLQAKRYQAGNTVGSEVVQAFIGALVNRGAAKGVLITTSAFSKAALDVASQSGSLRLVLIGGDQLARFMVRFNVGVRITETIEIKRVDQDYFDAELRD